MGSYPLKTMSVVNGYGGCFMLPPLNQAIKLINGSLLFPSTAWELKERCRNEDIQKIKNNIV